MSAPAPGFELPNVGAGPDPFDLRAAAADYDAIVLLFQRDHYCGNCRKQVRDVAARYEAFERRNTEVVSIVPEPADRVRRWQAEYDLPFALLADADKTVGDRYDQPTRFGPLGTLHDLIGRMPAAVVLDTRDDVPEVVSAYRGSSTFDRPSIEALLAVLDDIGDFSDPDDLAGSSSDPAVDRS